MFVECFQFCFFHAAFGEQIFHLGFIEFKRFRIFCVLFDQFIQVLMDILDYFIFAVIAKRFLDQSLESFFLASGCERRYAAEQDVGKAVGKVLCIFGIIQKTVDIGAAVVKCRE